MFFEGTQFLEEVIFENSKKLIEKNLGVSNIEDDDLLEEAEASIIIREC